MAISNIHSKIPTIYNSKIRDEELEIYTPSDIHKLLYLVISNLDLGIEIKSAPKAYIGNIEYEVIYITLNDSNQGIFSQISIMYRTCTEQDITIIRPDYIPLDIVEFIVIDIPNLRYGGNAEINSWSINLNKKIEETEEEYKKRKKKEALLFGGELEDFDILEKDLFFKETFPRFMYTTISKYNYVRTDT